MGNRLVNKGFSENFENAKSQTYMALIIVKGRVLKTRHSLFPNIIEYETESCIVSVTVSTNRHF